MEQFDTMRRCDVTLVVMATLMTSLTRARSLPGPVHYDMDEKLPVGTAVGRGLLVDADLAAIYSTAELGRLRFSLVRGLPPDLASRYFIVDQRTGLIQVQLQLIALLMLAWLSGSVVAQRRARLILGLVTVCGWVNHLGM